MKTTFIIVQIIASLVLIVLVLLQAKGTGLGRAFASSSYHSRRGVEFVLFRFTILTAVVFVVSAIVGQLFV